MPERFFFPEKLVHSENIYDGLDISPFKETCLYIYRLVKLVLYKFLNVLFSREFICLRKLWSLMDYIDTSLGAFLPMLRKGKGLSGFF